MLFKGSESECEDFVNWLNSLRPGVIKYRFEYSRKKVEFLDLEIILENEKIETNLFIKRSNLQLYLDYFSNHPDPCKEGVVFGQALRIRERCSKTCDTDVNLENLKDKLMARNYPEDLIDNKFDEAKKRPRGDLIFQNRKRNFVANDKVRLFFTHNRGYPPLHQWIRESKQCLFKNEKAKKLGDRIQICYSQPKNIKRMVSSDKQTNRRKQLTDENPGCSKCNRCRVSCPILKEGVNSKAQTQEQHQTKNYL